ncbi:hypothetical protein G9A89_007504 [Geosiphon pyriformis]|nr:hypothetical protein G9A89_007504 [Geosiphon pyriformis]
MDTQQLFFALHVSVIALVAFMVHKKVPEAYMDEVFHVPQAQRYCALDYRTWDPMLTTPPGLYVISNVLFSPFLFSSTSRFCSTTLLRSTNFGFAIGLHLVIKRILLRLHPYQNKLEREFNPLVITLFPIVWFYNFLYYTDPGSTFFVLLGYLLALECKYKTSALVMGISILFRQTNITWVAFILGVSTLKVLSSQKDAILNPKVAEIKTWGQGFNQVVIFIMSIFKNFRNVMIYFFPFFILFIALGIFIKWNDGIVLGDRSHHTPIFHFPQIFYFASFTLIFGAPIVLSFDHIGPIWDFVDYRSPRKLLLFWMMMTYLMYMIHEFSFEHPYLLADNRHYSFYLWKNVYRRHKSIKYLLLPFYITAIRILGKLLTSQQSFLWTAYTTTRFKAAGTRILSLHYCKHCYSIHILVTTIYLEV